jgi:hypothetical protein
LNGTMTGARLVEVPRAREILTLALALLIGGVVSRPGATPSELGALRAASVEKNAVAAPPVCSRASRPGWPPPSAVLLEIGPSLVAPSLFAWLPLETAGSPLRERHAGKPSARAPPLS